MITNDHRMILLGEWKYKSTPAGPLTYNYSTKYKHERNSQLVYTKFFVLEQCKGSKSKHIELGGWGRGTPMLEKFRKSAPIRQNLPIFGQESLLKIYFLSDSPTRFSQWSEISLCYLGTAKILFWCAFSLLCGNFVHMIKEKMFQHLF